MRTVAIVTVFVALTVIIGLLLFTAAHWRRFRHGTDRLRAWQSVYGRTGGKVALVVGAVAIAVLVGAMAAVANLPPD
jgi:hypothetical protein